MMLARALAPVPGLLALHEPKPHLITEGYLRWKGELSPDQAEVRIRSKRADLIEQVETNGLAYIESSHYCSHLIPELARLFGARFVFLHRDPRGFTKSGLARPTWYPKLDSTERAKSIIRRRVGVEVGNYWHDHRLDPPAHLTTRMEKIAWLWAEINRVILRDLSEIDPDRVFEFRLGAARGETFRELLEFIGVDATDKEIAASMLAVAQQEPNKRRREPEMADAWNEVAFHSITEPISRRLGYSTEVVA